MERTPGAKNRSYGGRRLNILQNVRVPWLILFLFALFLIDVLLPTVVTISYLLVVAVIVGLKYQKKRNVANIDLADFITEENPDVPRKPVRSKASKGSEDPKYTTEKTSYTDDELPWTEKN